MTKLCLRAAGYWQSQRLDQPSQRRARAHMRLLRAFISRTAITGAILLLLSLRITSKNYADVLILAGAFYGVDPGRESLCAITCAITAAQVSDCIKVLRHLISF